MEEKKKRLARSGLRGMARFCALQKLYEVEFEADLLGSKDALQKFPELVESGEDKATKEVEKRGTTVTITENNECTTKNKDTITPHSKTTEEEKKTWNKESTGFLKLDAVFLSDSVSVSNMDKTFLIRLLKECYKNLDEIDQIIKSNLSETWSIGRLDPVTKCILRLGITEIMRFPETPENVIFNEYIEIAKAFFETSEVAFINGLLNKVGKKLRK